MSVQNTKKDTVKNFGSGMKILYIFLCSLKKESHTGLERHEDE